MEFNEWIKKNSPPADFILSLPDDNDFEEKVIPVIREHWAKVQDFISGQNKTAGKKSFIYDYRDAFRCFVGKRSLGALLGMGS